MSLGPGVVRSRAAAVAAALAFAVAAVSGVNPNGAARAADAERGKWVWAEKAGCQRCHGWAGNGEHGFHSEGLAPSLRLTQLTRDQIREAIQCGRPGTPMPHFDRFAYTDKRCYDMTAEDLGASMPNRSPVTLQPYEIDGLADYVATKIKDAGPVTRAQCLEYFGAGSETRCEPYGAE